MEDNFQENSDTETETEDTSISLDSQFYCTICNNLLLNPRVYECGHTLCEPCMINNDVVSNNNHTNIFNLPIFKCPLCRHETTVQWYNRPKNQTLIDVLSVNPEYKQASDTYNNQINGENNLSERQLEIPERINLSYVANTIRNKRAEQLYNYYLPILLQYALEGKTYITITDPVKVAEIASVADILSHRLITQNGIFRFFCSSRECQIEILPRENIRFDYENNHFNADFAYTDPNSFEGSNIPPNNNTILNNNSSDVLTEFSSLLTDESLLNLVDSWRNIQTGRNNVVLYARNLNNQNDSA